MTPHIIDGKAMAKASEASLKEMIKALDLNPKLIIVTAEPDEASKVYMRNKRKACERIGIECEVFECPPSMTTDTLLLELTLWNNDPAVSGIIVQLPMPERFDVKKIQQAISPIKDVDGFHPNSKHQPCTPEAVITMLINDGFEFENKRCVVIGRSDIVGKPLANMLRDRNANVTVCHSKTSPQYLSTYCQHADYIFCCAGVRNLVRPEYLMYGQTVVVDVSINQDEDGYLCGDLHPDAVFMTKAYTPVPGGVGPMTVNTLMLHTVMACAEIKRANSSI